MKAGDAPWPRPGPRLPRRTAILWSLGAVGLVLLIVLAVPAGPGGLIRERMGPILASARSFQQAAQMLSLDRAQSGDGGGLPADLGVKSFREYVDLLTRDGYLTAEDVGRMHLLEDFALVNASRDDPPETALLVTRSFLDRRFSNERIGKGFVVFRLDGSGGSYPRPGDGQQVLLPDRQPRILPPGDAEAPRAAVSRGAWALGIIGSASAVALALVLARKRAWRR